MVVSDDYHHSLPDQARNDAQKLAVYQALGYSTFHVWASELAEFGVAWWFAQIPGLEATKRGGYRLYHTQDDSAGIRAANAARRTFKSPALRSRRTRSVRG